jgi:hypothetical protein
MNTLFRSVAAAAILATGGAMLATAQGLPDADTRLAEPSAEAPEPRVVPAQFREGRDGRRGGHDHGRRGGRGALLGAFGPADGQALFAAVDGDGDGSVTQAEIDAYLAAQVQGADADGDGDLALEEFAPFY